MQGPHLHVVEAGADRFHRLVLELLVEAAVAAARPGGVLPHLLRIVTAPRVAMPAARLDARLLLLRAHVEGVVHVVQEEEPAPRNLPLVLNVRRGARSERHGRQGLPAGGQLRRGRRAEPGEPLTHRVGRERRSYTVWEAHPRAHGRGVLLLERTALQHLDLPRHVHCQHVRGEVRLGLEPRLRGPAAREERARLARGRMPDGLVARQLAQQLLVVVVAERVADGEGELRVGRPAGACPGLAPLDEAQRQGLGGVAVLHLDDLHRGAPLVVAEGPEMHSSVLVQLALSHRHVVDDLLAAYYGGALEQACVAGHLLHVGVLAAGELGALAPVVVADHLFVLRRRQVRGAQKAFLEALLLVLVLRLVLRLVLVLVAVNLGRLVVHVVVSLLPLHDGSEPLTRALDECSRVPEDLPWVAVLEIDRGAVGAPTEEARRGLCVRDLLLQLVDAALHKVTRCAAVLADVFGGGRVLLDVLLGVDQEGERLLHSGGVLGDVLDHVVHGRLGALRADHGDGRCVASEQGRDQLVVLDEQGVTTDELGRAPLGHEPRRERAVGHVV